MLGGVVGRDDVGGGVGSWAADGRSMLMSIDVSIPEGPGCWTDLRMSCNSVMYIHDMWVGRLATWAMN